MARCDIRILVVDDGIYYPQEFVLFLKRNGFVEIEFVTDGVDVLSKLESFPANCIISDYQMPVMDGIWLLRSIRNDRRFANLPFVLMSGMMDDALRTEAAEYGVSACFQKGEEKQKLLEFLDQVISELD